jgi:ubiquitin C-terminal hydrolase
MLKAILDLFVLIDSKKKKPGVIDNRKFVLSVKKNNRKAKLTLADFNNEDHHDAHEFLIWLLDNIHENIKIEYKKQKRDNLVNF